MFFANGSSTGLSDASDCECSLEFASKIEVYLNDFFNFGCSCVKLTTGSAIFAVSNMRSSSICSNDYLLPIPNLAFGLFNGAAERTGRGRFIIWFAPLLIRT